MDIKHEEFTGFFRPSKLIESRTIGDYVFPNISLNNFIIINNVEFLAVYDTGCSYLNGDYSAPSPELELSTSGESDELLVKLNRLSIEEVLEGRDNLNTLDVINGFEQRLNTVLSNEDMVEIHKALIENLPLIEDFVSLDIDDYELDPFGDENDLVRK